MPFVVFAVLAVSIAVALMAAIYLFVRRWL